ncbi:radical SAM family heme chaperone HemW [Anaerotalea alkaliphila]|uniref:Heme chaperone HemW n=1 Tax=Anaerotalea alkaliphila TaxID=2662126 RepID=A0A7X5KP55_9FIRM|nr:radical SAM family heme chaperone HemW [Anaerotalea alkaliphila]NDL68699.1 oxygen-independent coproporphyrinogen III oxidase [Anaerotalea alkaliphila]
MTDISLYIHIPFCRKKCDYCDFLSFCAPKARIHAYVKALVREVRIAGKACKKQVRSVFIGGGTPTILEAQALEEILQALGLFFVLKEGAEVTVEANPGTLTREKARALRRNGVNRISLGLQATQEHHLQNLGRIHSWKEFQDNYRMLREEGFDNINVDLMSALPGMTAREWKESLRQVVELGPEHISCYSLIIEEGTPFATRYPDDRELPSDVLDREMYWMAHDYLASKGYIHYEISNYSRPGRESRHNQVYWRLEEYLGLGLGASSFVEGVRFKNTELLEEYLSWKGQLEEIRREVHPVPLEEAVEEFMFLGLRQMAGVKKREFEEKFEIPMDSLYGEVIQQLKKAKLLRETREGIQLTRKGIDLSNRVLSRFLL